ncbi:MAG: hypothetical protein IJA10_00585 [Lachnospiraceae bacterium]|nr:hypothetical protein [Lachnospiraceae bacterium]
MKQCYILIYEIEEDYLMAMMEYMNSDSSFPFLAVGFSNLKKALEYIEKNEVSLILSCEENVFPAQQRVVLLSKEAVPSEQREKKIYKYQSGTSLKKALYYTLKDAVYMEGEKSSRMILVYSPLGRCGKTAFSMALAGLNGEKPNLYLSFEEVSSLEEEGQMEEIILAIKERMETVVSKVQALAVRNGNREILSASRSFLDSKVLSYDDFQWFLEQLKKSGFFGRIVVDMGNGCLNDFRILSLFGRWYLPVLGDEISVKKLERFEDLLSHMQELNPDIRKKIRVPKETFFSQKLVEYAEKKEMEWEHEHTGKGLS